MMDDVRPRNIIPPANSREQSRTVSATESAFHPHVATLRGAALVIDGALMVACYLVVSFCGFLLFFVFAANGLNGNVVFILFLLFLGLLYVLWILYFVVPTMIWGQSFGKRMVGLQLIKKDGTQPAFPRLLIRESLKILSITSMIGVALNALEIAWFKITWYDRLCGTTVIEVSANV